MRQSGASCPGKPTRGSEHPKTWKSAFSTCLKQLKTVWLSVTAVGRTSQLCRSIENSNGRCRDERSSKNRRQDTNRMFSANWKTSVVFWKYCVLALMNGSREVRKVQRRGRQSGGGRWLDVSRGVTGRACLFTGLTLVKARSFPPRLYRLSRLPSDLRFEGRSGPAWGKHASTSTIRRKGDRPKL